MGITNTKLNLETEVARWKGELETKQTAIERIEAGMAMLEALRERVTKLDALIASAEMVIREGHPDWSSEAVEPRRKTDHHSPIPFGMLGRTALDVLRDGPPEGLRTREAARELLIRFNLDPEDRKLLDKTANSLGNYLKGNEGDLVASDGERLYKR